MADKKASVYLTSPVFREIAVNEKVSPSFRNEIKRLYDELAQMAALTESTERFPDSARIRKEVESCNADFIGCHLSHNIDASTLLLPSVKAVATSTAGYNHIESVEGILITNTPSVLDKATADYTIAIILSNLRDITGLHNYVCDGKWEKGQKWDLDNNLGNSIDNLTLGIVGLGEIGREVVRRIAPWGVKIIYYSRTQKREFEEEYPELIYVQTPDELFAQADIVSLHLLLNDATKYFVNETLLRKMKSGSLLVNTARGEIINFNQLVKLLKNEEIAINLAFDVFENEPVSPDMLEDFRKIGEKRRDLRFTFLPHNASADADTRAKMAIIMLSNLIAMVKSKDLADIEKLDLIPPQREMFKEQKSLFKICEYWS